MRILVTGSRGFVGRHVQNDLQVAGHEVLGLIHAAERPARSAQEFEGDICDANRMRNLVRDLRPDACLHLAGVAFVPVAWSKPEFVFEVNVQGTLNVLDAFRTEAPEARILIISSAEVYGLQNCQRPLTEQDPMNPENLYAVSKQAADLTSLLYTRRYGMAVMTARPCNHIGPGQSADFVVPAFARQVNEIASGRSEPRMRVGNLESTREFLDVRDVVEAYRLILEKGQPGLAYNVGAGGSVRIGLLLEKLCRIAGVQPQLEVDAQRYRPTDARPVMNATRLREHTGWQPRYTLDLTLADVLAELRPA
jgi:GDP-4-dehydro-6-deoxy-D-mannose reductase